MELTLLDTPLVICRLQASAAVPEWAWAPGFVSVTRTSKELSIVCGQAPEEVKQERGWRAMKMAGPLDFGLTGVLAGVIDPLRDERIAVFVVSTFDTDYVLVRERDVSRAVEVLRRAGHVLG